MGGPVQATQGAPAVLPAPDCNAAAAPRHDGDGLYAGTYFPERCEVMDIAVTGEVLQRGDMMVYAGQFSTAAARYT